MNPRTDLILVIAMNFTVGLVVIFAAIGMNRAADVSLVLIASLSLVLCIRSGAEA